MNTLVIVLIAMVVLALAYVFYGRRIANKWGIDPNAETPAVKYNDGKDYVPTNGWTVFSHQFSSIAGAGPVTGAIQAAVFGWVPVLLWILIGGVFFGAVTDFGALYASVKNKGKSMGMLIEQYIGKLGRKLFTIFCWLFSLLVIAVFADMVSGTFTAFDADTGVKLPAAARQVWYQLCLWYLPLSSVCFKRNSIFPVGKSLFSALYLSLHRLQSALSARLHSARTLGAMLYLHISLLPQLCRFGL